MPKIQLQCIFTLPPRAEKVFLKPCLPLREIVAFSSEPPPRSSVKSQQMGLGDGAISKKWISEAPAGRAGRPTVNNSSEPGRETNLSNFCCSSAGSQPSPNTSSISLKGERQTYCQVLPARVAVQAVGDVIAEAFSEIVHELGSLKRVGREEIKPSFSPWQLLATGPGHSPG